MNYPPLSQVKELVLDLLVWNPGLSNSQIQKELKKEGFASTQVVHAICDLMKRKRLERVDGLGPRGGYGYFIKGHVKPPKRPTEWEHLLTNE